MPPKRSQNYHSRARNNTQATLEREIQVWNLLKSGLTQYDVAAQLGINQGTVSLINKRVGERLEQELTEAARAEFVRNYQILTNIRTESMAGWEQSKNPTRTLLKTRRIDKNDQPAGGEVSETSVEGPGDPRFLELANRVIETQNRMLGLDKPQKIALTDSAGNDLALINDDNREARIREFLARAASRALQAGVVLPGEFSVVVGNDSSEVEAVDESSET